MAGFFGFFDFTRPGPGVPKNAPPKSRPRVFFEVFGRKFGKIIQINLLFTLFNIPGLVLLFVGSQFMFPSILFDDIEVDLYLRLMFGAFFICFPVLCFGPAQAGMTFCLRNFSREEHAFVWSDFKEHGLNNFKQGILICLIDFVMFLLLCIAINFYGYQIGEQRFWAIFTFGVIALAFLLFIMMHLYIYPMLVTFHITVKQLYKNALIFATIRFIPNLGVLLLCAAIIFATFIITEIGVLLFVLITSSLIGLIVNFYAYPTIKKYMIDKMQEAAPDENASELANADESANAGKPAIGDAGVLADAGAPTGYGAADGVSVPTSENDENAGAFAHEGVLTNVSELANATNSAAGEIAAGVNAVGGDAAAPGEEDVVKKTERLLGNLPSEKVFVDGRFVDRSEL